MGKAKFRLSTYRLEQLLQLPYEARILDVVDAENPRAKEFWIVVEHKDLPNGEEIFPYWNEITVRKFIDWGLQTHE